MGIIGVDVGWYTIVWIDCMVVNAMECNRVIEIVIGWKEWYGLGMVRV